MLAVGFLGGAPTATKSLVFSFKRQRRGSLCQCPEPDTTGRPCVHALDKLPYWLLPEVTLKKHWPRRWSECPGGSANLRDSHEVPHQESSGTWAQSPALWPHPSSLPLHSALSSPVLHRGSSPSVHFSSDLRRFPPQGCSSTGHRIKPTFFSTPFKAFHHLDHKPFKTCLLTALPCSSQFSYISRPAPWTLSQISGSLRCLASTPQSRSSLKAQAKWYVPPGNCSWLHHQSCGIP